MSTIIPFPLRGRSWPVREAELKARLQALFEELEPRPGTVPHPVLLRLEALADRLEAAVQRLEPHP